MILAHLDLDAFFAAVEELEAPELKATAARRRRRPARPRGRRDRELCRPALRDPLGDVVRRGAPSLPSGGLPAPAPPALQGVLARGLGLGTRGRARPSSTPGSTRATSTWARSRRLRARARRRGGGAGGGPRDDEPHVLARRRVVQGRRQGRERPAQARWADGRAARPRGGVPRPVRRTAAARGRARAEAAAAGGWARRRRRPRGAPRRRAPHLLPGKVGRLLRDRARGIDPRGLEHASETSRSRGGDVPRATSRTPTAARGAAPHAPARRRAARGEGQTGRTVTTKVRYPDFSIRSRSTSLPVGTATRAGSASSPAPPRPCARRSPGRAAARRRGVSGLEPHRQLALV